MHLIVRLEIGQPLLNRVELGKLVGLSPQRIAWLAMTKQYQQIKNQYLSGVLATLDVQVKENLLNTQEALKFAVPIAMEALLKQVLQEKDKRIQNKAANDILDRDGHFAKVTRVGLATPDQGGAAADKDNKIAAELIAAMSNSGQKPKDINSAPESEVIQ